MDELLKVIYENLGNTKFEDWTEIMKLLKGADDAETINNVLDFVAEHFSFAIEEGAEGYVYYGSTESTKIWKVVEGIVKDTGGEAKAGYISSTQAGKLFNDKGFNDALEGIIKDNNLYEVDKKIGIKPLYDGDAITGKLEVETPKGKVKVRALNDFFSENYIKNLKCSNIRTIFSGNCTAGNDIAGTLNCFGRTEFFEIMDNELIKTINGIDKDVFYYIYGASPAGKEIENVCEALKASEIPHISNIYYKMENGAVKIVSKETAGAVRLVDTMIAEGKISSSTDAIKNIMSQCDGQLLDKKAALEAVAKRSDEALADILMNDSEIILKHAGKETLKVGEYTISKGKGVTQVLKNGIEITVDSSKAITTEEALAAGYKEAVYNNEKVLLNDSGMTTIGTLKVVINGALTVITLHDAYKHFKSAADSYAQGNYRTGSTQLIEYGTTTLAAIGVSELFTIAATTVCALAGVATCGVTTAVAAIGGCIVGAVRGGAWGRWLGKTVCNWLGYEDRVYSGAGSAYEYYSDPLVLDLANDGFQLLSKENGVYFDENAEGLAEKTDWVAPEDALLAIDLNEDGMINDGSELFGTSTRFSDGSTARNAFAALNQYDLNGDNMIDVNDGVFSKLKVWQDKNSDGISQENEMYSMNDLGIESISLNTAVESGITSASVKYTDGSSGKIGQFNFGANLYDTADKEKTEISEEIGRLPNVRAMGNVASLHVLMQRDESGILKEYVKKFVDSSDIVEKRGLVSKILMFITGAENVASDSRGSQIDAKKLVAVEQLMGRDFVGRYGSNPVNTSGAALTSMYDDMCRGYYSLLSVDSSLYNYMDLIYTEEKEDGSTYVNADAFNSYVSLCESYGIDMTEAVADMGLFVSTMNPENENNFNDYIQKYISNESYARAIKLVCDDNIYVGTDGNDSIGGSSDKDSLFGGAGNDVLSGANGDDYMFGDAGDDTLYGGDGDDKLYGGTGNDMIYGGYGDDTYYFSLGDGDDVIYEVSGSIGNADRIVFGEGISEENVSVKREGNDLVIRYSENDKITVNSAYVEKPYCGSGYYFVENVEFADGTVWDTDKLTELAGIHTGTDGDDNMESYNSAVGYDNNETFHAGAGNDVINAGNGNDVLYGDSGNDTLYGGDGDDKLYGGIGNDMIYGSYGDDTYYFNIGDGDDVIYEVSGSIGNADRIVFNEGISEENVSVKREGNDLVIRYSENDKITVNSAYVEKPYCGSGYYFVENVEFADGTVWDTDKLTELAGIHTGTDGDDNMESYNSAVGYDNNETFHAGAGNDVINAGNGNDVLYGDSGNDTLYGGDGDDKLYGGIGNDMIYGSYGDDTYYFHLGDGEDIIYEVSGSVGNTDRIVFNEGISEENVSVKREGNDLVIRYSENDKITVNSAYVEKPYCGSGYYFVENVEFADGTVWDTDKLTELAGIHTGTDGDDNMESYNSAVGYDNNETFHAGAGNDVINAGNGNDVLYGDSGNDTLYGGDGDDKLYGGIGNDMIYGSYGDDTYYFHLGDGEDIIYEVSGSVGNADRIVFNEGISEENVSVKREGNDLVIRYSENDKITVNSAYVEKPYCGSGYYFVENVEFADGTVWDTDKLTELAGIHTGTDGDDNMESYNSAVGYDNNETFHAGAGNDVINAGNGNDVLYGDSGNDTLYGGDGDDKLYGGIGNDMIYGSYGDDTYYFHLGDGEDIIYEVSGSVGNADRIVFNEGISEENVSVKREGNDLVIRYSENDKITVNSAYVEKPYCGSGYYFVENVEFADGTVWDTDKLTELAGIHTGTDGDDNMESYNSAVGYDNNETFHAGAGNDVINAGNGNDMLYGDSGNDTLYGGDGDDKLYGGIGNDMIYGSYGDDTYYFHLGDGEDIIYEVSGSVGNADRIVFNEGISEENVSVKREGNDLVIRYSENDKITVNSAYVEKPYCGSGYYFVENVEFADGTVWDTDKLTELAGIHTGTDGDDKMESYGGAVGYSSDETFHAGAGNDVIDAGIGNDVLYGDAGDDTLYGGDGDDKLYGGSGNDILYGGYGDDTYYFSLGDGEDIIDEVSGSVGNSDRIVFCKGISEEGVTVERDGNDLIIRYSGTDKITINDAYVPKPYFGVGYYFVENVEFEGSAYGNIDYDNVKINITERIKEQNTATETVTDVDNNASSLETVSVNSTASYNSISDSSTFDKSTIDAAKLNKEMAGTSVMTSDNKKPLNTETVQDCDIKAVADEKPINTETITGGDAPTPDTALSTQELTSACAQEISDLYLSGHDGIQTGNNEAKSNNTEKPYGENAVSDAAGICTVDTESSAENMANLIIQDMAENVSENVTNADKESHFTSENEKVQLWAS